MYQRVNPEEIALFALPPDQNAAFLSATPVSQVSGALDTAGLKDAVAPDQSTLSISAARKRRLPRRWIAAQVSGEEGERTFVLEKNQDADREMELDPVDSLVQSPVLADAADEKDPVEGYVWDIFVQTSNPDTTTVPNATNVTAPVNAGRLIVNQIDRNELFGDIYESDGNETDKVETDDEDENAEDFYGADYPEEEDEDEDGDDEDRDEEYYGSDDDGYGHSGYYNEATGRFTQTRHTGLDDGDD
jgi:Transcription factor Iwr1